MKVTGADKIAARLAKLKRILPGEIKRANRLNGQHVIRTAKVLVPRGDTGEAHREIKGQETAEGYLMDFGKKSKVIEGGRKPGTAKTGKKYGGGPAQPFVNPALSATGKRRSARVRTASRRAVKQAMADG